LGKKNENREVEGLSEIASIAFVGFLWKHAMIARGGRKASPLLG